MRYIGSKSSTVNTIFEIATANLKGGSFCDPFGGTSTVGAHFKNNGFKVYTGDLLLFAHYFQIAKLHFREFPAFLKLKERLHFKQASDIMAYFNSLEPDGYGWLVDNYAIERQFFNMWNAGKIQICWRKIIEFEQENLITLSEKAFLLASLINSMDKIANTAGTYYAYLKSFNKKSSKNFHYDFIQPAQGSHPGESFLIDAKDLINKQHYDIIYLDPPYNDRKYHSYYHLPETIANCIQPVIKGKSGVSKHIVDLKSNFYTATSALDSLKTILANADFKMLLFHYRDDGVIPPQKLLQLFEQFDFVKQYEVTSLGYTTSTKNRSSATQIYTIYNA